MTVGSFTRTFHYCIRPVRFIVLRCDYDVLFTHVVFLSCYSQVSNLPLLARFGLSGILGNGIFVAVYNWSIYIFDDLASTFAIYSVVYALSIPLNHFLNCGLVFGFPPQGKYLRNLASNVPVGLSTLVVGAVSTTYLEKAGFEDMVVSFLSGSKQVVEEEPEEKMGEQFYISLVVLIITGIWSFVLLNIVNAPQEEDVKKKTT